MSLSPRPRGWLLGLSCVSALLLSSCTGSSDRSIVVGSVSRADVVETVDAAGAVTPRSQAILTSPDDAVVAAVLVNEGQRVKEGDVLVQLSSSAATARLAAAQRKLAEAPLSVANSGPDLAALARQLDASAKASFASARAAAQQLDDRDAREQALELVDLAERQYRANRAAAARAIQQTEQGLATASGALAALSDAQHDAAVAGVAAAQAAVTALTVRAPFAGAVSLGGPNVSAGGGVDLSGIAQSLGGAGAALGGVDLSNLAGSNAAVTTAEIEPGAHLAKGTPVATVVDATSLSVAANVDETDILAVKLGDGASIDLDAVPGARYPGAVIGIDQLPATTSGGSVTYRVRMTLRGGSDAEGHAVARPRAGMSAVARITVKTSTAALSVPAAAIMREGGHDSIWVVRGGRAHLTDVVLAAEGAEVVAIESAEGGLAAGDRVVIKGADRVKEGVKLS